MYRFALLAAITLAPWVAYGQPEQDDPSPFSEAALLHEQAWVQPGTPVTLGVQLVMDDGWHSYWKNPGDSGEPTEISWDLPEGFSAGPLQWPFPEKIDAGPLRSYGYADRVLLLSEITPPATVEGDDSVQLTATANWLICADVCLFAEETVTTTLPVRSEDPPASRFAEDFAQARTHLPQALPGWDAEVFHYSQSFGLRITPPAGTAVDLDSAYFFPAELLVLEHAVDQPLSREGNSFLLALQQSEYATGTPERLEGVLVAREGQYLDADGTVQALAIDIPVQDTPTNTATSSPPLLLLLMFALGGGMLLNLMPCVFPIISIKVLGFVQHGNMKPAAVRWHGLTFAGGVIISFWILAGLLLALRAAGNQIGWGFQLQSPIFVAGMAMLFFAIGLSLLGVFGISTLSVQWAEKALSRGGYQRSFWDGALATLVATPCTAPLMGAALGAAVVLPTLQALLIFSFLGLGMAAPYVVLSVMPKLLKKIPKPGAWMETVKHILAFPMIATTIWLIWVFGKQVGTDGMGLLLFGLLLLSTALWILGRWPAIQISQRMRLVTRTVAGLAVVLSLLTAYQGAQFVSASTITNSQEEDWTPFSIAGVEALQAEGRSVFVDFTAAWCLTCQVNKRTTLNSRTVQDAFRKKDVVLMRADWTSRDSEITRALASHGRNGVPLYVLYPGSREKPVLLPEVLSETIVINALTTLPDKFAGAPL